MGGREGISFKVLPTNLLCFNPHERSTPFLLSRLSGRHAVRIAIYRHSETATGNLKHSGAVGKPATPAHTMDLKTPETSEQGENNDIAISYQTTSEDQKQSQPPSNEFQGPKQDDSTLAVYIGLRTIPARFLIWFNTTFCLAVGIAIATRLIDGVLDAYFPGSDKATVAMSFVVFYAVYTLLAYTLGVFCGIVYELWRNPYARAPTLRGKVGREEEVAMMKENRLRAKRLCRFMMPWKKL